MKPLVADRLVFPSRPAFDPLPFFDDSTAELYFFPLTKGRDPSTLPSPPWVQVRAAPRERLKLFKKMAISGLLQPVAQGSFLLDHRNGLFAAPKDAERDRMVLDGRPAILADRGQSSVASPWRVQNH